MECGRYIRRYELSLSIENLQVFKETLRVENYVLLNLSTSEISAMAQLRFGILPLNVETGRLKNQPTEQRICNLCELNERWNSLSF